MAALPRIFYRNIANDTAYTITVTTEASTFDKENAIDAIPTNTYRSTSQLAQYYTFNGTTGRNIKGCAIINTNVNIFGGDTLELHTSDNDFASTDESQTFVQVSRTVEEMDTATNIMGEVTYYDYYTILD
ncbi:unnamed protein product, partial [marine sediment metagenome]